MFFSDETADSSHPVGEQQSSDQISDNSNDNSGPAKPRILIGSQRNPDAYRSKQTVLPVVDGDGVPIAQDATASTPETEEPAVKTGQVVFDSEAEKQPAALPETPQAATPSEDRPSDKRGRDGTKDQRNDRRPGGQQRDRKRRDGDESDEDQSETKESLSASLRSSVNIPLPTIRGDLSDDLEEEFAEIFGNEEFDAMLTNVDKVAAQPQVELDSKQQGRIVSIGRDSAFVELGGREQGAVPLKQFKEEPAVGETIEVKVVRFLPDEGVYELTLPLAAADVSDWSQIEEGMVVEAKVTGHNAGGLECEVNRIRAFIPMSQISIFRVENAAEFVGQKLMCVVTECNPMRRNLVLSHRALLEREREENRQKLFNELEIGQIRDGLVRKLIDSGAFVDLGGVDGFLPISALAWGRVKHPGDVISEGQRIKVRITNIDQPKNRISLSYRDESTDPWLRVEEQFAVKMSARGKVSKVMDFGAFVELMPGVEGLVHISELSLKRVGSVSEVVAEGDWVDVMIVSVDKASKRIGLSMKQLMSPPESEKAPEDDASVAEKKEALLDPVKKTLRKGPLKGGLTKQSDGDQFGLKF